MLRRHVFALPILTGIQTMSITFTCTCGKRYRVDDRYAGRAVTCKACGLAVTVPPLDATDDADDAGEYDLREDTARATASAASRGPDSLSQSQKPNRPPAAPTAGTRLAPVKSSDGSVASNPGRLYVEIGQYLRCNATGLLLLAGFMGVLAAATPFIEKMHGMWWLPFAMVPVIAWFALSETKKKMANGDVCPAAVIGDKPLRVAVFTDLSAGDGRSHPAVYVMNAPGRDSTRRWS
jgi:hypothetical protein